MHPKELQIADYTYELPNEQIAYSPAVPRDSSKLLIYKNGEIQQNTYRHLVDYLDENTTLVFNDTKVINARVLFQRVTGATIEIFCLEPYEEHVDYVLHFQKTGSVQWKCLVGNVSKWKEKYLTKELFLEGKQVVLSVELIERIEDAYVVEFSWTPSEIAFGQIIEEAGATPLPPYIKRSATKIDASSYQTVYSNHEGSVAAPTAGLHFTEEILQSFKEKGIQTLFTTLHVGAGTFKPVKSEKMEEHVMHNEWMDISITLLESLLAHASRKTIAVGTTSTRTLESIFWMGNKICNNPAILQEKLPITQWEPYDETITVYTKEEAISALVQWMEQHHLTQLTIETGIIIAPSYSFKIIDGIITNFHQPQSTLLLLVAALVGEKQWRTIYEYALKNDFRFLSYGDGSLLMR